MLPPLGAAAEATNVTGELTVLPAAGAQMLTVPAALEHDVWLATVTIAFALFVLSAFEVAVTVCWPVVPGAVYRPAVEMVPAVALPPMVPSTLQTTLWSELFCTLAVNCAVMFGAMLAVEGDTVTLTAPPFDETTLMTTLDENTAPVLLQAFTTSLCVPTARPTEVEREAEFVLYCATLSTYRRIALIVVPEGAPATACTVTGEVTDAPAAGAQIVTVDGIGVHAVEVETFTLALALFVASAFETAVTVCVPVVVGAV